MLRYAAAAILAGTTALAGTIAGPALAADENDQFAVRGAGIANCQQYLDARDSRSQQYFQFGGWMNGYLSGINRFQEDTFDMAPWQSPDFLASALANYCNQNPDESFHNAVLLMAQSLAPQRLETRSEPVDIPAEGAEQPIRLYEAVLERAQAALAVALMAASAPAGAGEADGNAGRDAYLALQAWLHRAEVLANLALTYEICGWGNIDLRPVVLAEVMAADPDVSTWDAVAARYTGVLRDLAGA